MVIKLISFLILFAFLIFPQEKDTTHILVSDTIPKFSYETISEFRDQMDDIFNDPNFSNANWGVVIQSLETGEYFYKRNENKLFIPASNLKLFTTAAALISLGPDYKFKTNIFYNGNIDGSVLYGDLIIRGMGDPTISGRFYDNDMFYVFNSWADSLLNAGIEEIRGNIIGDDNEFDDTGLGKGWAWDYESEWFSAPTGAISFNENCVDIVVSNKVNNSSLVKIFPETKYVVLLNKVIPVSKDSVTSIEVYRERGTNIITVFGTIREGDSLKTYATVNNPTQYSMVVLKKILESKGIKVKGFPVDIDEISDPIDISKYKKLFVHYSKPLKEIIKVINKNSQNFYAEQLLKTIGFEKENKGTVENGIKNAFRIFREMGINTESMIMVDGSGLSRLNLVTPRQINDLLNYMYKSKYFIPFYNSLSIAGIDGTLGKRMKNSKAENNVRAKSGFLENVRSISGYLKTGDNELLSFTMIVNNFNVPVKLAENLQDLVCLRLANFRRK